MKISIVVPIYNLEKYIHNTLDSIIKQSSQNFELILVDDGSTDDSINVVNEFLKENSFTNFRLIKKDNGGVSLARNRGLAEASGDYVLFLDGDDYIAFNLIEEINYYIKEFNAPDVLSWGYNTVNENKEIVSKYKDKYSLVFKELTGTEALSSILVDKDMWICTGNVLYKRDFLLLENLKYTEGCRYAEDQEFNYKALSIASKVIFIGEALMFYLIRETSAMRSFNIKKMDAVIAYLRLYEYLRKNSQVSIEVINYIKNEKITKVYLDNLLSFYLSKKNLSIKKILKEVDLQFPNLNNEMLSLLKNYNGNDQKLKKKINLFLFSKKLYFFVLKMKDKIK